MAVQHMIQQVPAELSNADCKPVTGVSMLRPCSRAVALVLSTMRSNQFPAGAGGHTLVTDVVVDSSNARLKTYTFTKFCILDNIKDLKMDPPKGAKRQAVLMSLTGVIETDTDSDEQRVISLLVDD